MKTNEQIDKAISDWAKTNNWEYERVEELVMYIRFLIKKEDRAEVIRVVESMNIKFYNINDKQKAEVVSIFLEKFKKELIKQLNE